MGSESGSLLGKETRAFSYITMENKEPRVVKNHCRRSGCNATHCTLVCGRCRVARYCSAECQKNDWTEGKHKEACAGAAAVHPSRRVVKRMCKAFESLPPETKSCLEDMRAFSSARGQQIGLV